MPSIHFHGLFYEKIIIDTICMVVCAFKLCNHVMKYTSLVLLRSIMMPHMKYLISLIYSSSYKWIGSESEYIELPLYFLPPSLYSDPDANRNMYVLIYACKHNLPRSFYSATTSSEWERDKFNSRRK